MASQPRQLRILFIPFMAPGHIIPMVDMAKLFSLRGLKSIILTTYGNSTFIPTTHNLDIHLVPFPSTNLVPKSCENMTSLHSKKEQMDFIVSTWVCRSAYEEAFRDIRPDAVVSDIFFPWTVDVAADLGIPRISFQGTNIFFNCAQDSIYRHKINELLSNNDSDTVVLPGLPHHIEMFKTQLIDLTKLPSEMQDLFYQLKDAQGKSYGMVVNSFCELEPDYVKYCKDVIGLKAWHVGPVSLCNKEVTEKASRGNIGNINHEGLKWLDSQQPESVLYICFGSLCNFSKEQLKEIAKGLEEFGKPFIWVVRKDHDTSEWMTEGLERMVLEGKGLIIRGWAPQTFILNHISIGGFMTHCGWNSSIESISSGVPMITWPLFADQFYNEKLVVDLAMLGISVGIQKLAMNEDDQREPTKAEDIKNAIERLMGDGEEAKTIRKKAKDLQKIALEAMECGGSSYNNLSALIEELGALSTVSST